MLEEKYVNSIVKKVKSSKQKKEEIRKELLAEIADAVDAGENVEAVMARMGDAASVADEFNQNLSDEEKKKYKKKKKGIIWGIVLAVVIVLAILIYWMMPKGKKMGDSGLFKEAVVKQQVETVIEDFNNEDFAALKLESVEKMRPSLNKETFEAAKEQISDDWGPYQGISNIYMSELQTRGNTNVVCQVNATYQNTSVTYTLSFDQDMMLNGLYMK